MENTPTVIFKTTADNMIEIPREEYNELVRASEKIAAVERFINESAYTSEKDILIILGIKKKEKEIKE